MSIKQLKSGKWQVTVTWYDSSKKRHFKRKSFRLKTEALQYEAQMQIDKSKNMLSTRGNEPFPDYFWKWFETYKEANVADRTYNTYLNAYHNLKKYLDGVPIAQMDRRLYRKFIADFGKSHAKSTVRKYNTLYHAFIKDAIYDGDVKRDFIRNTDIVYDASRTKHIEYLNIKEMQRLTDYLENSLNPRYTSKYMIITALFTGARLGEIQGLKWKDIDFAHHTITINRAWLETKNIFKSTKNESSKRIIRVNEKLLRILSQLKKENTQPEDQVFLQQFNTIPSSSAVNKVLRKVLKELNIEKKGFHFHSLRHTHVAFLLAHHIDLYIIAKRLGHADITTTSKVYSYLIDEYRVRSDDEIEKILNNVDSEVKLESKKK